MILGCKLQAIVVTIQLLGYVLTCETPTGEALQFLFWSYLNGILNFAEETSSNIVFLSFDSSLHEQKIRWYKPN